MPIRAIKDKHYRGVSELYRKSDGVVTGYYITYRNSEGKPVKRRVDADNRDEALRKLHDIKQEIERSAYEYQKRVESGETTVVGVNRFTEEHQEAVIFKVDPAVEHEQRQRLASVKASRTQSLVDKSLQAVKRAAVDGANLVEPIIDAARNKATLGEICDVLREVYGTFEEGGA